MSAESSLAERLGVTSHVSLLRMKLRRLREAFPIEDAPTLEDWLLDLANARGVTVVSRSLEKLESRGYELPGREVVSDGALVVALCQLQGLDRPPWLRAAAQLITKGRADIPELLHLARRERVERYSRNSPGKPSRWMPHIPPGVRSRRRSAISRPYGTRWCTGPGSPNRRCDRVAPTPQRGIWRDDLRGPHSLGTRSTAAPDRRAYSRTGRVSISIGSATRISC